MKIVAHRGVSSIAPENTLPAVELGWKLGVDAVEIDVCLTRDLVPVVHHDPFLKWWCAKRGRIAEMSYQQLSRLDVGRWKGSRYAGTRIPIFDDVLLSLPKHRELFVEIKSAPSQKMFWSALVGEHRHRRNLHWISFDHELLIHIRQAQPLAKLWWILDYEQQRKSDFLDHYGELISKIQPTGLDYCAAAGIPPWLPAAQAQGFATAVWTVDDPIVAEQWRAAGCDYLTSNVPQRMYSSINT